MLKIMNFFKLLNTAGLLVSRYKKNIAISLIALFVVASGMDAAISQNTVESLKMDNQQLSGNGEDIIKNLKSMQKGKNELPASTLINTKPDSKKKQRAGSKINSDEDGKTDVYETGETETKEEPLSKIEKVYNDRLDTENNIE